MNEDKLRIRLKNILDNKGMLLQNATFDLIVELVLTFTKRMSKKNNKQGQKISMLEAELQYQLQVNTGSSSKDERIAELEDKIKKMEYKVRPGYYEIKNILIENERLRKVLAHSVDRIVDLEKQNDGFKKRLEVLEPEAMPTMVKERLDFQRDMVNKAFGIEKEIQMRNEGSHLTKSKEAVIIDLREQVAELEMKLKSRQLAIGELQNRIADLERRLANCITTNNNKSQEINSLEAKLNEVRRVIK